MFVLSDGVFFSCLCWLCHLFSKLGQQEKVATEQKCPTSFFRCLLTHEHRLKQFEFYFICTAWDHIEHKPILIFYTYTCQIVGLGFWETLWVLQLCDNKEYVLDPKFKLECYDINKLYSIVNDKFIKRDKSHKCETPGP